MCWRFSCMCISKVMKQTCCTVHVSMCIYTVCVYWGCLHVCVFALCLIVFRDNTWGWKNPTGFISCYCSAHRRSHMRKLSLPQTQQKSWIQCNTTRNDSGWQKDYQTYNLLCNHCDFLNLKKGSRCRNGCKSKRSKATNLGAGYTFLLSVKKLHREQLHSSNPQ